MTIAVIGGSGLDSLPYFSTGEKVIISTPYGAHSGPAIRIPLKNTTAVFLPRHGSEHEYPPHKVNYRANLHLLKTLGIEKILACNVVGGISCQMSPRTLVAPHQIIDYTWGREHTFFDGESLPNFEGEPSLGPKVKHIDFSQPYSEPLRKTLLNFLQRNNISHVGRGVYGCTQGPRLETGAEIDKMAKDGCDIVGMTAMPEAALAREIGIDYVSLCLVVNWAPGITDENLSIENILQVIATEMKKMYEFLPELLLFLALDHET